MDLWFVIRNVSVDFPGRPRLSRTSEQIDVASPFFGKFPPQGAIPTNSFVLVLDKCLDRGNVGAENRSLQNVAGFLVLTGLLES